MAAEFFEITAELDEVSILRAIDMQPYLDHAVIEGLLSENEAAQVFADESTRNMRISRVAV